ncbi:RCC1 domain-containing protein [Nakamurella alba]|uniref:RCC1 domain-containing protein n=1 Tax=Nakamurella alba TaxID=2665158 RepID=UPI0018AA70EF|nr:RCC1 domain-containing protein [Nakamurella alba]
MRTVRALPALFATVALLVSGVIAVPAAAAVPPGPAAAAAPPPLGTAVAWGLGGSGQIGDGGLVTRAAPVPVAGVPGGTPVSAVSAGGSHTCAVSGGAAYCWGDNTYGQVGDGTTTRRTAPVRVGGPLIGRQVTAIAAGGYHTCAVASGGVYCWGYNFYGELGNGLSGSGSATSLVPVSTGITSGATAVDAGKYRSCAIVGGGALCWGSNSGGQTGRPSNIAVSATPVSVAGFPGAVTLIGGGDEHMCAVAGGAVYCWGDGSYGQRGDGTRSSFQNVPTKVDGGAMTGRVATAVTGGQTHTCAVGSYRVVCWGGNNVGQLGSGSTDADSTVPVLVYNDAFEENWPGPATEFPVIDAGEVHTCVLFVRKPYCWGGNTNDQLGTGDPATGNLRRTPVATDAEHLLAGRDVVLLAAGGATTIVAAEPPIPASFRAVRPARLLDTRSGASIPAGGTVTVQVTGRGPVVGSGIKSVALTITAIGPSATGSVNGWAAGAAVSNTPLLHFTPGSTVGNQMILPLGSGGKVVLRNNSQGRLHLLADVTGYWFSGPPTKPGTFANSVQYRVLDTRAAGRSPIPAGGSVALVPASGGGFGAPVTSPMLLNLSAVAPAAAGNLVVDCDGRPRPGVATVQFVAGRTVANMAVTPSCPAGRIRIWNTSSRPVQVIVDRFGYFLPGTGDTPGAYVPVGPRRILDTRPGALLGSGQVVVVEAWAAVGTNDRREGMLLTLSVTGPSNTGSIAAYPTGIDPATVRTVNFPIGRGVSGAVAVGDWRFGAVDVRNDSPGPIDLIVDLSGWFRANR